MSTPGRRQFATLLSLGAGAAGLSRTKGQIEPLLKHGWVTAEWKPPYYQWVRITAEGHRALAAAVDRYGLPDIARDIAAVTVRVCSDCGSKRRRECCRDCGAGTYHYDHQAAEELVAAATGRETECVSA